MRSGVDGADWDDARGTARTGAEGGPRDLDELLSYSCGNRGLGGTEATNEYPRICREMLDGS